jgi:hypothetical protein
LNGSDTPKLPFELFRAKNTEQIQFSEPVSLFFVSSRTCANLQLLESTHKMAGWPIYGRLDKVV